MPTIKKTFITDDRIGKEEINFPEFPLGICSQQQPKEMSPKLEFIDLVGNDHVKVTIFPSSQGYPNQFTRDLLRTLMRITYKKNRFTSSKVETSFREILKELGISPSGQSVETIKKGLRILAGTRIEYEKSFFDKRISDRIKTTLGVNIISSYIFQEAELKEQQKEHPDILGDELKSGIFWNPEFFEMSLKNSKNLIDFDYTYYISLENNITKELYLLLNKRAYSKSIFKIELKILAFEKLGISRTLENKLFKVRQQLKKAHTELINTGFLKHPPTFSKESGIEYITYHFSTSFHLPSSDSHESYEGKDQSDILNVSRPNSYTEELKNALIEMDFTEGEIGKLFKRHDAETLRKSVKLCLAQKRIRSKKKWLYKCLLEEYDLSEIEKQEMAEKKQNTLELELQQNETEQEEIQIKKEMHASVINSWIKDNQQQYLALTEENLNYIEQNESTLFKTILNLSRKKNCTPLDILASSTLFNSKVRAHISDLTAI